jgi:fructose-1,6-bisphosphatase/sedoheptulose 1,7-bisphosphatase-like protein
VSWRGETDVVTRLIQPVYYKGEGENDFKPMPYYQIEWGFFTLQDAVDFAVYAVESTIELMRFQPRPQTVGGRVDVLAITPDGARWVHKKELGVSRDFYNPFD